MRALLAACLLAAPVALACDPAEMEAAMTEICRGATAGAAEAIETARPRASAAEAQSLAASLARLERLCAEGDPVAAARAAALLARDAGRIEARAARAQNTAQKDES
ncbi:hypothetical protein [Sabulicella rubraurantiaca]|uniref:hypothetical protein n=1 Tax=Sabulicella rubraurantiaca TaxID=2811429 RepID=UPI001A967C6E|nr:hypothetical protein [Sabulicella rubraurantiaca]